MHEIIKRLLTGFELYQDINVASISLHSPHEGPKYTIPFHAIVFQTCLVCAKSTKEFCFVLYRHVQLLLPKGT